jgi:hypothetical protein
VAGTSPRQAGCDHSDHILPKYLVPKYLALLLHGVSTRRQWFLKTLQKLANFQAEYEGSIPFTRSNSLMRRRFSTSHIRAATAVFVCA